MAAALAGGLFLAASAARAEDTGKVFMWKAQSDTATVYLLGTIHFSDPGMYPLNAAMEDAFLESGTVVMELSMSMENQMKATMLTMQAGVYPGEETLSDHVSEETFAKLVAHINERSIPLAMVNKMRPWLASIMLVVQEYTALGFDPALGVDKHFYDKAVARGIPIWELETIEYQLSMFSQGDEEVQELSLLGTLEQLPKTGVFLQELMDAWLAGEPETLNTEMKAQLSDDERLKPLEERLIYGRNDHMVEKIEKLFENEGTYFVMVGSAHLVGDRGIVAQLEGKGYEAAQVEKAAAPVAAAVD